MPRLSRHSLFGRTAFALVGFTLLCQILFYIVSARLIVWPLLRSTTEDLAALMMLSAHQFVTTPPPMRAEFSKRLAEQYRLDAGETSAPLNGETSFLPFIDMLQATLSSRLGHPVQILRHNNEYSVDIPADGHIVRFSFARSRIGTDPFLTLAFLFVVILLLSLGAALVVACKLACPLRDLGHAAAQVGQGRAARIEPQARVKELDELVQSFNAMANQVQTLIQNRTTLLAGISHDLRSPLARARVLMELAEETSDISLLSDLNRYLSEMEKLITDCLDFSRGITVGTQEPIILPAFLADLCTGHSRGGPVVQVSGTVRMVHANRSALTRVIRNLVENAQRYGNGLPVEINLSGHEEAVYIEVLDNGPGIPEEERERVFQPFVRLETSRNPATGGSGLGLAVVREICRAHGWGITLHNRRDGGLLARLCLQTGG